MAPNIGKHQVASVIPEAVKILDFQTNDGNIRVCSLAGIINPGAVAIVLGAYRASGSGSLAVYPNSGAIAITVNSGADTFLYVFAEGTQDLKFKEGTNNDDWDIYSLGEIIEGPVGK